MSFRIRPASPQDAKALRAVHAASFLTAYRDLIPEAPLRERIDRRDDEWYRKIIVEPGTPRSGTWVAEAEAMVVGFGHFRATEDAGTGDITLFYLAPEWWGRGVARPLLDHVLDDMRTLDFEAAALSVFEQNPRARSFYEHAGFRLTARVDHRSYGDRELAVVTYRLPL
jgi:ribosomal protein S18 acetylase RimI-like enzyme